MEPPRQNPETEGSVTRLLHRWSDGDREAFGDLLPLVYSELRARAGSYLRRERSGHTLQPTALVHEAYLRLMGQENARWNDRAHFFAIAAQAMRRILVDHARKHTAPKRGGGAERISIEDAPQLSAAPAVDVLGLDEALERLAELDPRQAKVVELRFFGGLTIEESAAVLDVSVRTVAREWKMAKAWLREAMEQDAEDAG